MNINKELLNQIVEISVQAGNAIMEIYTREDFEVQIKDNNSPLTAADTAADEIIKEALMKLTPDVPILSEESKEIPYSDRKDWKLFWLVDPLDGTKEFIKRNGEFTVNIALIEDGKPVLGVVYAPAIGSTYYGVKGLGAYKSVAGNEKSITVKSYNSGDTLLMVASKSHRGEETDKFVANAEKDNIKVDCVSMGSSLKFCLVAEGEAHIYPRFGPTMEWDTGAAQAVVEAAGGQVLNINGTPLVYNKENLLNPYFVVDCNPTFDWQRYIG